MMGRTNIVIDDDLMNAAMKAAGTTTKKETVEEGLRKLVETGEHPYAGLLALRGQLHWEGDLDEMRTDIDDTEPW
jgi:Arc/MetJ family transcription regulator